MGDAKKSLGAKLWKEAEPIAAHAFVVLVLETSILLIGLMTKLLEMVLPDQKKHLLMVELFDSWLALVLVGMFGLYTLVLVGIRLVRALASEWSRKPEPARGVE